MADNAVPNGTFGDYSPANSEAEQIPSNYEICQRSGFKVKPKNLTQQWDGLWVREDLLERRHPQDFVRPVPEQARGSSRPESADGFLLEFLLTEAGAPLKTETTQENLVTDQSQILTASDL